MKPTIWWRVEPDSGGWLVGIWYLASVAESGILVPEDLGP